MIEFLIIKTFYFYSDNKLMRVKSEEKIKKLEKIGFTSAV